MFGSQFDLNLVLSLLTNLKENVQHQIVFNYTLMIINQNILAILKTFLNLQKRFMKNSSPSKLLNFLATTKFLSKIPNRKKISNEHFNLSEAEISLDVL